MSTKRQTIVDTATRLFSEHGYHAVGTDWIIRESGVAKMTLFRHFPTKNELITEVLAQRAYNALSSMTNAVGAKSEPLDRLRELFEWHDRWFRSRDFSGCMFVGALSEFHSESGEIIRVAVAQKVNLRLFVQGILLEIVAPAEVEQLARIIVMLLDGSIMSAVVGDRKDAASDAWTAAEKVIAAATSRQQSSGVKRQRSARA